MIFDKYINTTMGVNGIAAWLNQQGYQKKKRQNNTLNAFAASFIKGVLDNPVYCGKLAYGRRKNEKIPGKRNAYHIVKQDSYMLYDGIHEAIVSEEIWNTAHDRRLRTGVKREKTYSLEHEHLLSGILCCPICGAGMYGNVNRKKKKDGSRYKDYFYYTCKHRRSVDGHVCTYKKQWGEDKVNAAVAEVIKKLVQNPKFEAAIRQKINTRIDTGELEQEIENLRKQLRQVLGAKNKLAQQMDSLDVTDRYYDRKYQDMQDRLDHFYDQIDEIEDSIAQVEVRIQNIRQQKLGSDNVYQYLLYFDKLYDKFTDAEKKEFLSSFVERVDIYEDELPDGRFLRHIRFKFPVFYNGQEIDEMSWDKESTVETVVLLSKGEIDSKKVRVEFSLEDMDMSGFQKGATYEQIKAYVLEHTGLKVSSLYISQIKRKCGLDVGHNYNLSKKEDAKVPQCPPEKEVAIREAFNYFGML